MFTGIIETIGRVSDIKDEKGNRVFTVSAPFSRSLKADQSVSHNGVCLTVIRVEGETYDVEAVEETLAKTNLKGLTVGDKINLERGLTLEKRLDGHLVQGHVDTVGQCISRQEKEGSIVFSFRFPRNFASLIIEKGSIAINGVSLTAYEVGLDSFSVSVIPYTLEHTTMHTLQKGAVANLEFDLIGKYALRMKEVEDSV